MLRQAAIDLTAMFKKDPVFLYECQRAPGGASFPAMSPVHAAHVCIVEQVRPFKAQYRLSFDRTPW